MAVLHVDALQCRQIANILWALGKCHKILGAREEGSEARAAAGALLAELERGGGRKLRQGGGPADAAQLLHGMARLKLRRPGALRALGDVAADPRRPAASSHLALALWGFGRLGWRDEGVLNALADRLAGESDRLYLRPWSMAAALRTFALMHLRHDGLAAAVAEVRAVAGGKGAPRGKVQVRRSCAGACGGAGRWQNCGCAFPCPLAASAARPRPRLPHNQAPPPPPPPPGGAAAGAGLPP
jgi:hypothetical protein